MNLFVNSPGQEVWREVKSNCNPGFEIDEGGGEGDWVVRGERKGNEKMKEWKDFRKEGENYMING